VKEFIETLCEVFRKRGFQAVSCKNSHEAIGYIQKILDKCEPVDSIGFGNSATLKSIGVHGALSKYTDNLYIHAPIGTGDVDRKALTAEFYITSANAISADC
jgi:hypothetical protein